MTKKRQQDFAKVQLKPGRPLGRRRNVTSIEYKARKITITKKEMKMKSDMTILDCLKRMKGGGGSDKDKVNNLNDLKKLIHGKNDSLFLHLSDIFSSVLKFTLDVHDGVRNAGLQVIISVLEATDDMQIQSFINLLDHYLLCAMDNAIHKIKTGSLLLLNCMLKKHPDLICNNMTILGRLLPLAQIPQLRKNSMLEQESGYSQTYQINVLGHVNAFLKEMLKNKTNLGKDDMDQQEVYWDCKKSLNLEIYAGGGLQPVNIEKSYSDNFNCQPSYFKDSRRIEEFIDTIVKLIPDIFIQIIGSESKADDNTHRRDTIADLSILFQVLSNVSEWATLISYEGADDEIKDFLVEKIYKAHRFPFELHSVIGGGSLQPLALLNISVSYLIVKFLICPSDSDQNYSVDDVIEYLKNLFAKSLQPEVKYDCIPYLERILNIYFKWAVMPGDIDCLFNIFDDLIVLLKSRSNHPSKKILISLFIKISLNPAYNFLTGSEGMKKWFNWLLKELYSNPSKLDKKLLDAIKKIANRKYPLFLEGLDFEMLRPLLKHHNESIVDTAIFLIYSMDINRKLLEDISNVIFLNPSIPKKFIVRLIRLLVCRFSEKSASERDIVDFAQFLLNIAVDYYNLNNEKMIDLEANEYTKAVEIIKQSELFTIVPSLQWKEHHEIFEVCLKCLRLLPQKPVSAVTRELFREILNNTTSLPIHCAIAILRLNISEREDKYYRLLMFDLTFSCLLTTSVLTNMRIEEEWFEWNVCVLLESIDFSRKTAFQTLKFIDDNKMGKLEGIFVYHILRIIKVFVGKHLLEREPLEEAERVLHTLRKLAEEHCYEKTLKRQPLYLQLIFYFINNQYHNTHNVHV